MHGQQNLKILSDLFFIITPLIIRPIISSQILQVKISLLSPYISCLKSHPKAVYVKSSLWPQAYVHRTNLAPEKNLRGCWRNTLNMYTARPFLLTYLSADFLNNTDFVESRYVLQRL
jgi:hypothetical protein